MRKLYFQYLPDIAAIKTNFHLDLFWVPYDFYLNGRKMVTVTSEFRHKIYNH